MLNKETKRRIDNARDILVGQLPLPSDQIELITIALIYKFMDDIDEQSRELGGKPTFFVGDLRDLSWRKLISNTLSGEERVTKLIQGIEAISDAKHHSIPDLFKSIFKNAFLKFRDAQVLKLFLDEINGFTYDHSEELGNAFEYLLDTMGTQGQNGQFRTPRNIIEFIVDVVDPQKDETILDPACGTAGFLISAYKHILAANTSAKAAEKDPHAGDLLKSAAREKLTRNITGYDITPLMCRLSRVNMYLHHFANPVIHEYDTLTNKNRWGDKFDVILANPPFMTPTGGISTHDKFRIAAKRAEVLFADFILEHLNANGRAGFIVPEGIIFQNNDDYVSLRKWLINEAGLWAVVSLPANIFQPYSGVKTSILLVDRALARQRDAVLLLKVENDGFSLNTNRTPIKENDLPDALKLLHAAKQPDYPAAKGKLETKIQHRLVPRADFAKLDAYKATSTVWDCCRKFHVRAERLKKAAAEARSSGDKREVEKAEKALAKLPTEFSTATGLPKLPDTEAELRATFDEKIKTDAITYGDDPEQPGKLSSDLREALDNQRDYNFNRERYGITDVSGRVWEFVKFGSVVMDMRNGVNFSKEQVGEGIPFVNIKDVFSPSGIVDCDSLERVKLSDKEIGRFRLEDNDLVFVRSSVKFEGAGFPAIVRPRGATIVFCGFVIKCSLDKSRIDPYFAMQLFRSARGRRDILSRASRANITNISQDSLEGLEIPLPTMEEQSAIVAELEGYQRVVGGCDAVLEHHRPSFTPNPDWPTFALHEVAEIDPKRPKLDLHATAPVSFLPMSDLSVRQGQVIPKQERPLDTVIKGYTYFAERDVIVAKITPCFENGKMGVIGKLKNGIGFGSTEYYVLRANSAVLPEFLFASLCHPQFITQGEANMSGSAGQQRLTKSFIHNYQIAVPDLTTQRKLVADLQREQATLAGLEEMKAKYAAKIAARLAVLWGEPETETDSKAVKTIGS